MHQYPAVGASRDRRSVDHRASVAADYDDPCSAGRAGVMKEPNQMPGADRRTRCQIKIRGHLDEYWSEWFEDLSMMYDEHDDTLLTGPVADQAALHGLLKKVRDMGLSLLAVNRVEPIEGA